MLIKNPYEHVLKNDRSGKYQSTKTESGRHGYGLNSIARIAEKYQGEISSGSTGFCILPDRCYEFAGKLTAIAVFLTY